MTANDPVLDVRLQVTQHPGAGRTVLLRIAVDLINRGDEPIDLDGDRSLILVGSYAMRPCPRTPGKSTYTADRDESGSVKVLPLGWSVCRIMPGVTTRYEKLFSVESYRRFHISTVLFEAPSGDRVWADWRPILAKWDESAGRWRDSTSIAMPRGPVYIAGSVCDTKSIAIEPAGP